jgi:hypothetical protein
VVPTEGNRADVDDLTPNNPTSDFLSFNVEGWEPMGGVGLWRLGDEVVLDRHTVDTTAIRLCS